MPLKYKGNQGMHEVGEQIIMNFGFERIMMNHIALDIISIITQEQKMYEGQNSLPKDRLTTEYTRAIINRRFIF